MKRVNHISSRLSRTVSGSTGRGFGVSSLSKVVPESMARSSVFGLSKRGFTLVEMLMVIVIILLLSMVLATGVPAALKAYESSLNAANAQLVLSTATTRLRDELSVANPDSVKILDDSETDSEFIDPSPYFAASPSGDDTAKFGTITPLVQYESYETGFLTTIVSTKVGLAYVEQRREYNSASYELVTSTPVLLVPGAAENLKEGSNKILRVKFAEGSGITYSAGVFTIEGLRVVDADDNQVAQATVSELKIMTLAAPTKSAGE